MAYPSLSFNTIADWLTWIDNNIITNGMELITGDFGNITENAAAKFISQSPLNWQTADIFSTGGAISPVRPVNVIMSVTPSSLTWPDNIYNQYIFINTTLGDIPSDTYYDVRLQPVTIIPAISLVSIMKAKNGNWIVSSVPSSGSQAAIPPLIGTVGNGGADDPSPDQPIFQSNKLIGLGATNNGEIEIKIANTLLWNFGDNSSFTFNNVTGEIDQSPNNFITGNGIYINLNQ